MQTNNSPREGKVAEAIETQTAKIPSDVFLWSAVAAMTASLIMQFTGAKHRSLFIGQWAAPILLLGVYNKLVKQQGHDQEDSDDYDETDDNDDSDDNDDRQNYQENQNYRENENFSNNAR